MGRHGLIGWWDGRGWKTWDLQNDPEGKQLPEVAVGDSFRVFALAEPIEIRRARAGDSCPAESVMPPLGRTVKIQQRGTGFAAYEQVALGGTHDPRPRPVTVLGASDRDRFREQARRVLAREGVNDPEPPIQQAIAVDIDGDSAKENLVLTERAADPNGTYSDTDKIYSVLFISESPSATATTTVDSNVAEVNRADPGLTLMSELTVGALVDVNGDGVMEISVTTSYYEGAGAGVLARASDGKWSMVISESCGV